MIRFALIGAGFIGSVHAQNLAANEQVDLRLVYDSDTARATALAARYGASVATEVAAFDPDEVDAVLIASSTDTHARYLRTAADAGLAIFCEKPIDASYERAATTVAYVLERTTRAMIDFNRRFDRDYAELRRIVRAGEIGEVELVQMASRGPTMPPLEYLASSGGQMRDQTVHFFDLATWITGLDPVDVFVKGSALVDSRIREFGDVDTSIATLSLANGGLVQIDSVRRSSYGYDERIEVFGSAGMAQARRQHDGHVSRYHGRWITSDGMHAGWLERVRPTYAAALAAFVRSLEGDSAETPTLVDALKAQAIAEAATRSLAGGRLEPISY